MVLLETLFLRTEYGNDIQTNDKGRTWKVN